MASLPAFRVKEALAFSKCGVDFVVACVAVFNIESGISREPEREGKNSRGAGKRRRPTAIVPLLAPFMIIINQAERGNGR